VNQISILKGLGADQIELLKPLFERFPCTPRKVIFQQGDLAEFLYLLVDGKVNISFKPYDGSPMTISHVGKGELFGWSAVVGSGKYTSSAVAMETVEAFRISGSELRKFCQEHPEAGQRILERLAERVSFRWKDAHKQVKTILFQSLTEEHPFL